MDISVPFLGQTSEITALLGHCFAVFLLYTAFIMIRNPRLPQTNTYMHTHTHSLLQQSQAQERVNSLLMDRTFSSTEPFTFILNWVHKNKTNKQKRSHKLESILWVSGNISTLKKRKCEEESYISKTTTTAGDGTGVVLLVLFLRTMNPRNH